MSTMKAGQTETGNGIWELWELTSQGFWKMTGTGIWTEGGQLQAEVEAGRTSRYGKAGWNKLRWLYRETHQV